jgi:hypothetical protein
MLSATRCVCTRPQILCRRPARSMERFALKITCDSRVKCKQEQGTVALIFSRPGSYRTTPCEHPILPDASACIDVRHRSCYWPEQNIAGLQDASANKEWQDESPHGAHHSPSLHFAASVGTNEAEHKQEYSVSFCSSLCIQV